MKYFSLFLALGFVFNANAQQPVFETEINLLGMGYTTENSPFWFHSNQRGRMDSETNVSGWINSSVSLSLSENSFIEAGAGLLYYDGFNDEVKLDESYVQYQNKIFEVILGRKQKETLYNGLSASNDNILWSLNARPLPGFQIKTTNPINLWKEKHLSFEASLEEYWLGNNRVVEGARLHHKSFHFIINPSKFFNLKFGLQHFVQWAGNSPVYGELPGGFEDYLRVFSGQEGSGDAVNGEEINALGNHLGSFEIYFATLMNDHELKFMYNHLFEDGSGRRFSNFPDGRYGIFFRNKDTTKIFNALLYELYYTKNQSKGSTTTDGMDNYFQNQVYASGWTYEGFILGVPFITASRTDPYIINNQVIVHHFGFGGMINGNLPYKFLASYRNNVGAKGVDFEPNEVISTYFEVLVSRDFADVKIRVGSDIISNSSPVYGAGILVTKKLF